MEELVVEFVIPLRYRYPLDDDLSKNQNLLTLRIGTNHSEKSL